MRAVGSSGLIGSVRRTERYFLAGDLNRLLRV
jgi:hypothetical protein